MRGSQGEGKVFDSIVEVFNSYPNCSKCDSPRAFRQVTTLQGKSLGLSFPYVLHVVCQCGWNWYTHTKDFEKEGALGKYMRASDIEKVEELENPKFFSKEGS